MSLWVRVSLTLVPLSNVNPGQSCYSEGFEMFGRRHQVMQ